MNIKNIKKEKYFKSNQHGYAILFAVILVSIISMIVLGLSNTTYKQLVINSVAKDSQVAFYQSDTATECGLYLDNVTTKLSSAPTTWTCGVTSSGANISLNITNNSNIYDVNPTNSSSILPCFNIKINKTVSTTTIIDSRGYSSCNLTNFKTVERAIEVSY